MRSWKKKRISISPPLLISGSFLFLILVGTVLLKLPFATTQPISWTDALFTATSATTVTGLSVFDPGTVLTGFGELVLLVLIQCGGIGLMTFAVAILILFRKKVGLQSRIYLQESLTQNTVGGIVRLVKLILTFALTVEAVAAVLLTIYWIPEFGFKDALNYSVFHVISAFNNAGFSLFPDNMMSFVGDPLVNLLISLLFIIGGIGFTVVMDVSQKKSFHRWALHTKLMVGGTLILNAVAMVVIFALEYGNPGTIGNMSLHDKLLASYFSAVTPRTAGFNTLNYGEFEDPTLLFTMLLMFIGGGSASTASGIKLTTFVVVILATISFLRSRREPEIFGRSIRLETVIRSLAITTISVLLVVLFLFLLTITEKIPFLPLAFEVVSAFGTVGLSMGITAELSDLGEVLLSLVMFTGRIGPLTLFFILMKPRKENYRYPYDPVFTG
ncbi:trk system potassium uptake protein TrkH [Planomicrobium stackebrandtii]|uniref:Trk system potassium uptake protein TrkH n=1 Tax=Planomicrobium stackebrandtii TaxID=253160 RepID=A0ABU0GU18_9BACL|nr:TrkH family potassium uptake protein [Planomicrobium stackebrandtii]MDQ0428424.1 trk system potassium uptake protein TrkH [Planomicrobium stackebrandtii]